uniref:Uncharacterized protein n=1 Tax=Rhizophora mucronata TaxID=61149 RepID=A0A2P2NK19_RHIMU
MDSILFYGVTQLSIVKNSFLICKCSIPK